MMIFMLASAMTVAMLIATVLAIHHESARSDLDRRAAQVGRLGLL